MFKYIPSGEFSQVKKNEHVQKKEKIFPQCTLRAEKRVEQYGPNSIWKRKKRFRDQIPKTLPACRSELGGNQPVFEIEKFRKNFSKGNQFLENGNTK